jgi:glucose 1-dehydrogenase
MSMAQCPNRLGDQVALVTGSTHGIGLGIASRLAQEGAAVIINDEGTDDGTAVAEQIRSHADDSEVRFVEADVRDPEAAQRLVSETVDAFGEINILVNNVGEERPAAPGELSIEDWSFTMESTLRSAWLCTKYALEHMPDKASVINISSVHSNATVAGHFPYNVAKAGIDGLTRALAVELADREVRVNAISPGAIIVDDQDPDQDRLQQTPPTDPIGRMGSPADIAGLAAFLASDDASYITGEIIRADGGRLAVQQTTPDGR